MARAKTYRMGLVWLRRDLRIEDNTALSESLKNCERTAIVFVFDRGILKQVKNKRDLRVSFIYDSLVDVGRELKKKGSSLILGYGNPVQEVPRVVNKVGADALFFNEDYEVYAKRRDEKVKSILWKSGVRSHALKDQVIFSGSEIRKKNGSPYQVFTPYKQAWLKSLKKSDYSKRSSGGRFLSSAKCRSLTSKITLRKLGFEHRLLLGDQRAGSKRGVALLRRFERSIKNYHRDRDFPALAKTSMLSVHLRFGTISVREAVRSALRAKTQGHQTWLTELIWREFYQMILDQFPRVEKEAFQRKYRRIQWPGRNSYFRAWCEGRTGYPLVDAAMRQLNSTGWMHNRLRMVVASFLVKDLLIDWRKGERYFAEKLLDFDLASNNGGWQWCASTGCDSQPYFRIFHPVNQSVKFDPEGEYIREWVPELREFSKTAIHFPFEAKASETPSGFRIGRDYPRPIVDHSKQRELALRLFKRSR